jgi:cellulose synthase/poly-beta-1,6-N-acetylglucosamine synthase-like glycosyltransferase
MHSSLPDVSIIVPAYNAADTIARCVESLLAQDYPFDRYKVVVVDNNSSDDTPSIVRKYPSVTLAFEREAQTSYAARNRGLALTDTELVAFLDSDCVADRHWLGNLVVPFEDPDVGVVGGPRASQIPETGSGLVERFLAQVHVHDERLYHPSEPKGFPTANVAYRASVLDQVGIFDSTMPGGGDVDLAWRVQLYGGYRGVYVPEALVLHKHRATISGHFRQFRRYGFSEIVLATLYRRHSLPRRTPKYELRSMARQIRALLVYVSSFCIRLLRWRRWRSDHLYLASPALWFVLESGNLVGKLQGLVNTRFFRRNPYPTKADEVIRSAVATPTMTTFQDHAGHRSTDPLTKIKGNLDENRGISQSA